jgi:F0F1-type ATP synthase membrane subunit a
MGMVEGLQRQAEAMPRWYLVCMIVVAIVMLIGGAFWIARATSMMQVALGLAAIVLFAVVIYGLTHRPQT